MADTVDMPAENTSNADPNRGRRNTLQRQLQRVERELCRVQQHTDATAVHDLRVACRRASVTLAALSGDSGTALQALADTLVSLRDESSPLRDLDVLIGDTLPRCAAEGGPGLPVALRQALDAERQQRADRLRARLRALQPQLHAASSVRQLEHAAATAAAPEHEPLRRALRRLHRRGKRLRHDGERAEHRLRVAVKKLRYALESATEVNATSRRRWLRRCKRLQDDLGQLHDQAVAEQQLRERATSSGDRAFVEAFARWREDSEPPLRRRLHRRLRRLAEGAPPWREDS